MSNCTGVLFGLIKSSNGSGIADVDVNLNWIQTAEGGALRVGGDDKLTRYVPRCKTTRAGEYILPFFWESYQVPGSIASALAMRRLNNSQYSPMNKHGQLYVGVDVRTLIGIVAPPIPSGGPSAASTFLDFYMAATPELKGLDMLKRFAASINFRTTEVQGCYSNINFIF